jgi:hypothetical protein
MIEIWAKIASPKAGRAPVLCQIGGHPILEDLRNWMSRLSPISEDFGQEMLHIKYSVEIFMTRKARDGHYRQGAVCERNAVEDAGRNDTKDWEIIVEDQAGILVEIKPSEKENDSIQILILSP